MGVAGGVARFARAWIETLLVPMAFHPKARSPASRGRGLKLGCRRDAASSERVARFARAWIETPSATRMWCSSQSPASRGRGLKPFSVIFSSGNSESPASRGRGLKRVVRIVHTDRAVSPASRGRGLKLGHGLLDRTSNSRRPLRAGVD